MCIRDRSIRVACAIAVPGRAAMPAAVAAVPKKRRRERFFSGVFVI